MKKSQQQNMVDIEEEIMVQKMSQKKKKKKKVMFQIQVKFQIHHMEEENMGKMKNLKKKKN